MANKLPYTTEIPKQQRENWGYWDGVAARQRGRLPVWSKVSVYRCKHPFDQAYGNGFWMGWYGEVPHQMDEISMPDEMPAFLRALAQEAFERGQENAANWKDNEASLPWDMVARALEAAAKQIESQI